MASSLIDPDSLLQVADSHRAARDWLAAAEAYRQFVILRPDAWQILVQEGHCLKEAGHVAEALARYRDAEVHAPEDADLQVQIGHALKVLGRWRDAARTYARAAAMAPGNRDARREADATAEWLTGPEVEAADRAVLAGDEPGWSLPAEPVAKTQINLVFDITDVLLYFNDRRTPTGIQRVQIGIVSRALAGAPAGMGITLACFDLRERCWRAVDRNGFLRLCNLAASGSDPADGDWTRLRDAMRRRVNNMPPLRFPRDALLVNLGNSWSMPDYFRVLRMAQRESGLRYVPFVHDCVPLIVPEHCLKPLVQDYVRWFGALSLHAHGLLCNSENTRRDTERFIEALLPGTTPPAHVVRLDADPRGLLPPPGPAAETSLAALRQIREGESFALFVATLESRKNHLLVFTGWLNLIRKHGPQAVPRLVCVGKPGWHAEAAMNLLRNAPELQGHVLLMPQVSDQELDALYDRCAFTVYNSYYEGWGLPITEALAHGKIVVTPAHSALTEAGGDAALYFAPQSLPELTATLERLMLDPDYRAAREAVARQKGRPRSWDAVRDHALEALGALAARPAQPALDRVALELGRRYGLQRQDNTELALEPVMADLVREGPGWYPQEDWGVSCAAGIATLRLPLPDGAAGAPLRLYLEMEAPARAMEIGLRFSSDGGPATLFTLPFRAEESATCVFDLPATAAHVLEAEIDSGEGLHALRQGEARRLGIGLRGFMLCRQDDHLARLAFLENLNFASVRPE
ncbi:glycosyltransferase family 4 protein [Roseomonas marmotae]|uniref:Glycosyltransferase n=1 Tax=Roseomonas marmotae TaxID=2768161 RepID=A0ABS3K8S6_9PROT|nr:glycosyltransferase family 1 protein [Roseomonas marmotae]MBO1073869.1 glycosyltransferase [Roseomonas marmotae]QTI78508.1 glycosyltransferase [Roseomonas marmotae]